MARALANSENCVISMEYLTQTIELSLDFNKQFGVEYRKEKEEKMKQNTEQQKGGNGDKKKAENTSDDDSAENEKNE